MFRTWWSVRDVWKRPKLYWSFCKYTMAPCGPAYCAPWFRYFYIPFFGRKYKYATDNAYKDASTGRYEWRYEWRPDIQEKLNKWHLGWLKPRYTWNWIPWWFICRIRCMDVMWKTKYDDVRFERSPYFQLVIFGWSINCVLAWPNNDDSFLMNDHYWESLLSYKYTYEYNLSNTIFMEGRWQRTVNGVETYYFQVQPDYLQDDCLEEYKQTIDLYIYKHEKAKRMIDDFKNKNHINKKYDITFKNIQSMVNHHPDIAAERLKELEVEMSEDNAVEEDANNIS